MHQTKLIQKPSLDIFQASIIGDSAEFGEYNIATKINGVDSKFAENIDIQPIYGTSLELIPIINKVLHHFAGNIPLNAVLNISNAILLVILSVTLTLIGGLIPAKSASKKDPVIALRTE